MNILPDIDDPVLERAAQLHSRAADLDASHLHADARLCRRAALRLIDCNTQWIDQDPTPPPAPDDDEPDDDLFSGNLAWAVTLALLTTALIVCLFIAAAIYTVRDPLPAFAGYALVGSAIAVRHWCKR